MNPRPDKLMPSLYGGLLIATLWAIPGLNFINCLCCAGVMIGGFLAVLLYQKEIDPQASPLTMNDCLQLGVFAGIIASVAAVIIQIAVTMIFGNVAVDMMMSLVGRMDVEMPPEFYELIEQAKEEKPTVVGSIMAIFFYIIPNTMFAVLGSVIGWNVFKEKR